MSHSLTHKSTFATHMLVTHNFTQHELQYIFDSQDTITRKSDDFRTISVTSVKALDKNIEVTKFKVEVHCDIYNGIVFTAHFTPDFFEIKGHKELYQSEPHRRPLYKHVYHNQ